MSSIIDCCAALRSEAPSSTTIIRVSSFGASQTMQEVGRLSLEELANVAVTSGSKRAEPLEEAAAAVYVISGDELRRSGVTPLV